MRVDDLEIDLARRLVARAGEAVHLTRTELTLLEQLVRNPGKLLTQEYLLREVWGPGYGTESNYLPVYVGQLRKKLGDDAAHPAPDPDRAGHRLPLDWARGNRNRPPENSVSRIEGDSTRLANAFSHAADRHSRSRPRHPLKIHNRAAFQDALRYKVAMAGVVVGAALGVQALQANRPQPAAARTSRTARTTR